MAWGLKAATGHLVELSGGADGATLSAATALLREAQQRGEPVAWVNTRTATFFPPDLAEAGVALAALPVVRVTRAGQAARAAEMLLGSGGFSLVVLDLAPGMQLSPAALARLDALTRRQRAALLILTAKSRLEASLGCQVSLRADTQRTRGGFDHFHCALTVLRDRHRRPGWTYQESHCGPDGLC